MSDCFFPVSNVGLSCLSCSRLILAFLAVLDEIHFFSSSSILQTTTNDATGFFSFIIHQRSLLYIVPTGAFHIHKNNDYRRLRMNTTFTSTLVPFIRSPINYLDHHDETDTSCHNGTNIDDIKSSHKFLDANAPVRGWSKILLRNGSNLC